MGKGQTIRVPIHMNIKIIDGEPVIIDAEYADMEADSVARYLLGKLRIDAKKTEERAGEYV